jgi:acyl carrier protein
VARSESAANVLTRLGMGFVSPPEAFEALDELLGWDREMTFVSRQYGDVLRFVPHITTPRLGVRRGGDGDLGAAADLLADIREAEPAEAAVLLEDAIVGMIATTLGVAADRIDRTRPLDQLGVDSLMGAELVAKMRRRLGTEIPIMRVVASGDVQELSRSLTTWLKSASPESASPGSLPGGPA